jgi:hypothetical protein
MQRELPPLVHCELCTNRLELPQISHTIVAIVTKLNTPGRTALRVQTVIRGLAIDNSLVRNFSRFSAGVGGGGFVDCNSCMGEANSHGGFLAGLAAVYRADHTANKSSGSSSGARYLSSPSQLGTLAHLMTTAIRYLVELSSPTGEIRHEFCHNFSAPSETSCRHNYRGYSGPHHSAIALAGLLQAIHSVDSTPYEQINAELRELLPDMLRTVRATQRFLGRGAPLSSVTNGSTGHQPSCVGGNCYVRPWPELLPSCAWVLYRACHTWHGVSRLTQLCGRTQSDLRGTAVRATVRVYTNYSLNGRITRLTQDEGTFRGVPWFDGLYLAHLTALDEGDHELAEQTEILAVAIAQQYSNLLQAPGSLFHILPLLVDLANTEAIPNFPPNPQGRGLGNAALGLQALDAAYLGMIVMHAANNGTTRKLVQLMEQFASAAVAWVQGLNPGVPCIATSYAFGNGSGPATPASAVGRVCAASMVVHARQPSDDDEDHADGDDDSGGGGAPFVLPWPDRWWSGGAMCNHSIVAPSTTDTFASVPRVMSIVNGLATTTSSWTVGFPETYILHDGAFLRGVIAYEQLLDAMEDGSLQACNF